MTIRGMFVRPVFDRDNGAGGGTGNNSGGAPDNSNGSANGGQPDQQNQLGQRQQQQQPDEDEAFAALWNDEEEEEEPAQNQNNNNQQQTGDRQSQINEFFEGRVPQMEMSREAQEAFSNGDMEGFQEAQRTQLRSLYQNVFVDVNKLMEQRIERAVTDAVSQATRTVGADQAVQEMNRQLKYTSDPAIAPVARSVLGRAMKKAKSVPDAIKQVDAYFEHASKKRAGGSTKRSGFNQGNNNFNSNNNDDPNDNSDLDDINFDELLGVPDGTN